MMKIGVCSHKCYACCQRECTKVLERFSKKVCVLFSLEQEILLLDYVAFSEETWYNKCNTKAKEGSIMQTKLFNYSKKVITKKELQDMFSICTDEGLFKIIEMFISSGVLVPVKSSQTNGNRIYPIHEKYRINKPHTDYSDVVSEIEMLHPLLQNSGYLMSNPKIFLTHKKELLSLNKALFQGIDTDMPISRKERSFQIFAEEKVLDNKTFCSILDRLGLGITQLGYYDTPKYSFNDFILKRENEITLLILENKDIWYNMRRMMFEKGVNVIFDTAIDGIVYGNGNAVTEFNAVTEYTKFLGDIKVNYLYWGDIDREGLNIFCRLQQNNPEITITLFTKAYEEMLRLSCIYAIPDSNDGREIMADYSSIFSAFSEPYYSQLRQYISDNKRIPQEIITYKFLTENMR